MKEFVYHGTSKKNIKTFMPKEATQKGEYLYASESFEVACIFGGRSGDSLYETIRFNDKTGKLFVWEREPNLLKSHAKPVYVYKFPSKDFSYFKDSWRELEVRTNKPQKPLEVIKFEDSFEMLKEMEKQGKVELFLYPNRPKEFKDDSDLIRNAFGIYVQNPEKNLKVIHELAKLHPEFKMEFLMNIKKKIDSLPEDERSSYASNLYDSKKHRLRVNAKGELKK